MIALLMVDNVCTILHQKRRKYAVLEVLMVGGGPDQPCGCGAVAQIYASSDLRVGKGRGGGLHGANQNTTIIVLVLSVWI